MVNAIAQLQLLDVVALKEDLPNHHLSAGQVGTIVEVLAPEVYEVEFSDDDGETYAMLPLHSSQLLQLKYTPSTLSDETEMSNTIHQYGQGDNVAGNKVTNDFQGANLSGVIGSQFQDNASVSNNTFTQTNNANTAELLQLVASLRQNAAQFPEDIREEIIIDIEDVETEIQKPENERNKTKLRKRLTAIIAAATAIAIPIAGITDFTNTAIDLGNKLGIELILPSAQN